MNMLVWLEDGEVLSSNDYTWRQIPRDKKINTIGIYDAEDNYYELSDCTDYFFSDEASYSMVSKEFKWEARMVAGFNENGEGELIKVFIEGPAVVTTVYLSDFQKQFKDDAFIRNVYA